METKKQLRKKLLNIRETMSSEEAALRSAIIYDRVAESPLYKETQTLFAYVSFRNEVDTYRLMEHALFEGKNLAVPKVNGKEMCFIKITSLSELEKGHFGVMEPVGSVTCIPRKNDLILVPGSAFNKEGFRIGYGGGFYDRYFSKNPDGYRLGLCYDFQQVDFDPDDYDLPVDHVISDGK